MNARVYFLSVTIAVPIELAIAIVCFACYLCTAQHGTLVVAVVQSETRLTASMQATCICSDLLIKTNMTCQLYSCSDKAMTCVLKLTW